MNYGYTAKDRFFASIKRFFIKTFILVFVVVGGSIYFFKSHFGNDVGLIHDFKNHTNSQLSTIYQTQTTEFSNAVRKDLGLEQIATNEPHIINTPVQKKPTDSGKNAKSLDKPIKEDKNKDNIDSSVKEPIDNKTVEKKSSAEVINNAGFSLYKIGFYYDHSNAPSGVSKEEALTILNKASQQWLDACGIVFEYKGDKLADYVNNKNVIAGSTGIIKWETQMEGSAIGEAHVGNSRGPATGFVLALFSDFFARNKSDLINTVTHEMGHVIGLEHSANKNSIMFDTERSSATLQESDKAMCRYFRYRWSGMNENQAEEKAGVISNYGSD